MIELKNVRRCFESDRVLYSAHARKEMRNEEFGPIADQEIYELVFSGEIIEQYPDDMPYPSCLIYGTTNTGRPLHTVCAYDQEICSGSNYYCLPSRFSFVGRLYKEKKMRCLICHGEDIQTKQVREEIKVDKNIIYIPIQTPVCHTCGERYYDRRTVRYLEEMEHKLQSSNIHLQEVGKVLELVE